MKKLSAVLLFFFCFAAMLFAQDIFTLALIGTPEQIQAAINAGAKLDDRNKDGMTPLMNAAAGSKNPDVITTLLRAGAKLDDRDKNGTTPLMWAAIANQNPDMITTLLRAGAKLDDRNIGDWTPLMCAAIFNKNPDIITTLLKAGAKIDERSNIGMTPLMNAAEQNENPDVVMTLLNAGADPTIKSKEGKTALDYAQSNAKLKGTPAFEALRSATYGSANKTTTQTISTDWVSTPSGSYRVERLWQEGSFTYALVSYRNTTSRTFKDTITITALFYDANNRMLDMQDGNLYAFKNGPMSSDFEGTVKIMSSCTGAKRVEVRISGY